MQHSNIDSMTGLFINAAKIGDIALVKLLLEDKRVDPAANDNRALRNATIYGHTEVVRLLLTDPRVNPAASDNLALINAALIGYIDVVKVLLTDHRVNPAADNNFTFCFAASNGEVEVVKLLLADCRVDPTADNNYAIRMAAFHGRTKVIRLLLSDKRINPAADKNYAIRKAAQYGHLDVIILLLDHPAVLTYVCENLHHLIISNPVLQNALTFTHEGYNGAFFEAFFSKICKDFIATVPYYLAMLNANNMPTDVIVHNIAPHLHPFFEYYKDNVMCEDENNKKSLDNIILFNQSCSLLPMYHQTTNHNGDSNAMLIDNEAKSEDIDLFQKYKNG